MTRQTREWRQEAVGEGNDEDIKEQDVLSLSL